MLRDATLIILTGESLDKLDKTTKITRIGLTELLPIDKYHVVIVVPHSYDGG